jgi:hypothetical protein
MRNTAAAYASSASTNVEAYEDLPGHHILAVRNLIATTNDESYHGSASELPPATSHRYAQWDFSGMPDPVMFQRFHDAADYWFGCSDDSSTGSYDPARECFMVAIGDLVDSKSVAGASDGEAPQNSGTSIPRNPGPSAPPTSPARGADINAQLAQACELEAKLAEEYCVVRLLCASIAGEASACGERVRELGKQACERINADFNVNTQTRHRTRVRSSSQLQRCSEPCPHPRRTRRQTCTARRMRLSSKRPCNRPKARRLAYASRAARGTTAAPRANRHVSMQTARQGNQPTRAERWSRCESLIRANRLRT